MLGSKHIGNGYSWETDCESGGFERVESHYNGNSGGFVLSLPTENDLLENFDDRFLSSIDNLDSFRKNEGAVGVGCHGNGYSSLESHLVESSRLHLARQDSHDHHTKFVGNTEARFEGIVEEKFAVGASVGGEISLAFPGRKLKAYELPHQADARAERKRQNAIRAFKNRQKKETKMETLAAHLEELQVETALMREQKIAQIRVNEELERIEQLTRVGNVNSFDTYSSMSSPTASHESSEGAYSSSNASPTSYHSDVSYSQFPESSHCYPHGFESSDMYSQSSQPSHMYVHPSQTSNIYSHSLQSCSFVHSPLPNSSLHSTPLH